MFGQALQVRRRTYVQLLPPGRDSIKLSLKAFSWSSPAWRDRSGAMALAPGDQLVVTSRAVEGAEPE